MFNVWLSTDLLKMQISGPHHRLSESEFMSSLNALAFFTISPPDTYNKI